MGWGGGGELLLGLIGPQRFGDFCVQKFIGRDPNVF